MTGIVALVLDAKSLAYSRSHAQRSRITWREMGICNRRSVSSWFLCDVEGVHAGSEKPRELNHTSWRSSGGRSGNLGNDSLRYLLPAFCALARQSRGGTARVGLFRPFDPHQRLRLRRNSHA